MTSDDEDAPVRSNRPKWALLALTAVAVLAAALATSTLLGHTGANDPSSTSSSGSAVGATSDIASAHDDGPVTVVIDDPTCGPWTAINNSLASGGQRLWNDRDRSVPASAWNDKQRIQFLAAGQAMGNAAAQSVGLVKLTPHRVVRELYEQFIAYTRAYVEHLPHYVPADDTLAGTANSASSALGAICAAVADGSAAERGPLVPPPAPPSQIAPVGNIAHPQRFLTKSNPVCSEWKSALDEFGEKTADWQKINPNVPSLWWNKEQKATNFAVAPVMNAYAGKLELLGRRAGNPTLQDFAVLSAQYRRAFVTAIPTYSPGDNHLANAANYASTTVLGACAALPE
ncbi:hypothetical protein ACOJVU_14255 [Mycobacterium sp. THU-M104]|uniref:hypothetical protein n=1 Tax=Mycobacterium sp. THU-M104 TaxID=3410515 RepID=UPI003B9C708C